MHQIYIYLYLAYMNFQAFKRYIQEDIEHFVNFEPLGAHFQPVQKYMIFRGLMTYVLGLNQFVLGLYQFLGSQKLYFAKY